MTDRERFVAVLTGRPADRAPFMKVFGGKNAVLDRWERESPGIGGRIDALLGFEGEYRGWDRPPVNTGLSRLPETVRISEDGDRIVQRRGDGAVEIIRTGGDYHHQTVEWPVADRAGWERVKAEFLDPADPARFPADWPAHVERYRNRTFPLQLSHGGVYGFARNLMGDERLCYAFYDDPALVHDIMDTYTETALAVWERMTGDVSFDLVECWEDMACRNGSIVSPAVFREFMTPNYRRIAAFARARGVEIVLVDSDGLVEGLVPLFEEAGVTALYPFEVQAGNDCARVRAAHPRFGMIGGLDKNCMARGKAAMDAEVEKARRLIRLGGFIPGPDHFVLSDVSFDAYRYFMERLREAVLSTPLG